MISRSIGTRLRRVAIGALAGVVFALPAGAQDLSYFKGKTLRILFAGGAGSGFDSYARVMAPHLASLLGATVLVEDKPGAGGVIALNYIYAAKPDGLQIMVANGTAVAQAQLLDQPGVRYDMAKLSHLGIISASPKVWLVSPQSPLKSPVDAMKPGVKLRWAASGAADNMSTGAAVTCEALKLDCQVIVGYGGSGEAALAVKRGEVDAMYISDQTGSNQTRAGNVRPLASMGRKRSHFFPDLPTVFEAVKLDAEQEWWLSIRNDFDQLGRIILAPPALPPEILGALQHAVKTVLKDPAVVAEGKKRNLDIDFQDAEEARAMAVNLVGVLTEDQRKRVKEVLLKSR